MFRKFAAEFIGTSVLVTAVVGSGIMATNLSGDRGIELIINDFSTIFTLGILIQVFGPISGAHFNPVVTLNDLVQKRLEKLIAISYVIAQFLGATLGVIIANVMFKKPLFYMSHHSREGLNLFFSEVIATAGLVLLIHLLRDQNKVQLVPIIVAGWIGAAYLFTSSTSFANPAITFARMFSNSYSGISPDSAWKFMIAQLIGGALGASVSNIFYSNSGRV